MLKLLARRSFKKSFSKTLSCLSLWKNPSLSAHSGYYCQPFLPSNLTCVRIWHERPFPSYSLSVASYSSLTGHLSSCSANDTGPAGSHVPGPCWGSILCYSIPVAYEAHVLWSVCTIRNTLNKFFTLSFMYPRRKSTWSADPLGPAGFAYTHSPLSPVQTRVLVS